MATSRSGDRRTQADRRARTRSALLESAARGLSAHGYANLSLERVAGEAGYTRGALYHQFANKEELAQAVVEWVGETWRAEVGGPASAHQDPVEALCALARAHAVYCRRDIAGVMMTLQIEFSGRDHPVARALERNVRPLITEWGGRIAQARESGALPPGPPPEETASAYFGTLQGVTIALAGRAPHDVRLAEGAVRGVLGLPPAAPGEPVLTPPGRGAAP
ncbi:TetR/AcrR family transcriptional regulator [Nocardiopsis suaedae]|uniref:TetR/AcrR family transcriptional regulator n=1 Tax=Nocardiopsis suaedae TaxID=3018444 RepID=A0ABT4TMM9_9ACTN|nr:TetR/AcrR family transcriptional regulator [Nocardiopsis suaedae]MDA2805920.1 TetR/AcrR family transcriptional regulator [Nocardiopsis suaedae]